jgi:nucleotide-binding universal stress UspA family protein
MLRLACRVIGREGRVIVVAMTHVPPSLPLDPLPGWMDADANAALDRADAIAASLGVAVETVLTRVRQAADAIVGEARVHLVDAVFLPRWSWRHPLRRLRAMRVAHAVVQQMSCAVLLGACMHGLRHGVTAPEAAGLWQVDLAAGLHA